MTPRPSSSTAAAPRVAPPSSPRPAPALLAALTAAATVLALLAGATLPSGVGAAPASGADAPVLTLLRTLGDGEEVLLHGPSHIRFGPDGSAYVLNGGEYEVLRFDPDWNLVGRFGRRGQGPGEFENATGMIVHQDRVWVFEIARAVLFTLDGEYVETRTARAQLSDPVVRGDVILCGLDGADRPACEVDDRLELVRKLGQTCPTDDFFARYQQCGFVRPLAHPDHPCLLLHRLDGRLDVIDEDGEVARTLELSDRAGASRLAGDDDTISMSFTMVMAGGYVDDAGRLWVLPLPPREEDEEPPARTLVVLDRQLRPLATFTLPDDVQGYAVAISPAGELVLLDGESSLLHVLAMPELPEAPTAD